MIINKMTIILKVIGWVKSAWRKVTSDTIKHCFEKCGFSTEDYVAKQKIVMKSLKCYSLKYQRIVLLTKI